MNRAEVQCLIQISGFKLVDHCEDGSDCLNAKNCPYVHILLYKNKNEYGAPCGEPFAELSVKLRDLTQLALDSATINHEQKVRLMNHAEAFDNLRMRMSVADIRDKTVLQVFDECVAKELATQQTKKCLVFRCNNHSDGGAFVGDLCRPCHEMLITGRVHHAGVTFIHDIGRVVREVQALAIKHNNALNRF